MNDQLARLITIGVASTLILLTAYHRKRARRAVRALSSSGMEVVRLRPEGRIAWLRAGGIFIWVSLVLYMTEPDWMDWSRLAVPPAVPWLGAALTVASVPAILWVLRHLGLNLSSGSAPRAFHQLVKTGPYGWIRHPWYSALFLFLLGLSLLWSSWLLALLTATRATYFLARSRIEEINLVGFFGDSYREYARRVPKFAPWPRPRDRR